MEKAKIVIQSLDPLKTSQSDEQIQLLKAQLAEKDKHIRALNKDIEKLKTTRVQEEELVASAWYQLGAQLNRHSTDERIASIGNSFLSQQRHLQPSLGGGGNGGNITNTSTSNSSNNSSLITANNRLRIPSSNNNNNSNKSMLNTSVTNQTTASASS